MIHQLNIYGQDKVDTAIMRLKEFEPDEGYYLCFSGGKDSVVIKALAEMAGVKFDAHYGNTGIDPPDLVRFIKQYHPEVIFENPTDKDGNRVTMWSLISRKLMPPTRIARYCCQYLKEEGGKGRMCITGVRWAESANRKNNQGLVTVMQANKELKESEHFRSTSRGGCILNNDNTESRKMIDACYKQRKTTLNPIIDWSDEEVWEFIREYNVPYCKLYDEGFKRLGCVGCPMSSNQLEELDRFPKYKQLYLLAFEKMIQNRLDKGLPTEWNSPEEVMEWWTSNKKAASGRTIDELIQEAEYNE